MSTRLTGRALLEDEKLFVLKKHIKAGKCPVKSCGKDSKSSGGTCAGLCPRHYQARWRALNPKKSLFRMWKDHAAAREIGFFLTVEYVEGLTDAYCYYEHSPSAPGERLTIDRVRAELPYQPGNCRIVPMSVNSAKSNRERRLPEHIQQILERKREKAQKNFMELARRMAGNFADEDACPF